MTLKSRSTRTLACETLAKRELMAADITMGRGELHIIGDHNDDQIQVRAAVPITNPRADDELVGPIQIFPSEPLIEVRVADDRGFATTQFFKRNAVQQIFVNTGNGTNNVDIDVAIPSRIVGGSDVDRLNGGDAVDHIDGGHGHDIIMGGGGDDTLLGKYGEDTIHGGAGNDTISGGPNNDTLYGDGGNDFIYGDGQDDTLSGGEGDDELWGGSHHDTLYGQAGNDRLLGQAGDDDLVGGIGDDALIGGRGDDTFVTNAGQDRVLVRKADQDTVEDLANEDARITFTDATETELRNNGERLVEPGAWQDFEVNLVDEALQMLFDATGSNSLLRSPRHGEFQLIRRGDVFHRDQNGLLTQDFAVGGWNHRLSDEISITNNTAPDQLVQFVLHEIGHDFDQPSENRYVEGFRKATTWVYSDVDLTDAGFTQAEDKRHNSWYFFTNTGDSFAREYGQYSPLEDFASSFAAKIMTDNDLDYRGESPEDVRERVGIRFVVLDKFFASLA